MAVASELRGRDVVEHDGVVAGKGGDRRGTPSDGHDRHLQLAFVEGRDEVGGARASSVATRTCGSPVTRT